MGKYNVYSLSLGLLGSLNGFQEADKVVLVLDPKGHVKRNVRLNHLRTRCTPVKPRTIWCLFCHQGILILP